MGAITIKVEIRGVNHRTTVAALMDTGARRNFMRRDLATGLTVDELGISTFRGKQATWLADGSEILGDSVEFPSMRILEREVKDAPFVLVSSLQSEAIIGHLTMQDLDIHLRPCRHAAWSHSK